MLAADIASSLAKKIDLNTSVKIAKRVFNAIKAGTLWCHAIVKLINSFTYHLQSIFLFTINYMNFSRRYYDRNQHTTNNYGVS